MKKIISSALAFLLIFNQFPATSFAGTGDQNIERDPLAGYQSVQTLDDVINQSNKPDYRPLVSDSEQSDAYDYEKISPLTPSTSRENDESSFEDAVAQFSPDYASAVVVNKVQGDDLKNLLSLNQEVGVAVIGGKIVMFTSGSKDEIRVVPAAEELLKQSSLLIHTHPAGERAQPSLTDFEEAGTQTEYVVTSAGVYAYNHDGLVSKEPLTYDELASLIETAHAPEASSKEARDLLNKFIVAIDEYNQNHEAAQILRSANSDTVFARTPNIGVFGAVTAGNPVYLGYNTFSVSYDVSAAGSYAGSFMSFDDYSTTGFESVNLSSGSLVFDYTSSNTVCSSGKCFKMEFHDTVGHSASINIGVNNGQIMLPLSSLQQMGIISSSLDLAHIKEIVFVFEQKIGRAHV